MYKWVLLRQNDRILSCLIDTAADRTLEIHSDPDEESALRIGDIMTGRIDRIMHGLDAAFIDLPGGQKGYLPLRELEHAFFTGRSSPDRYCQGDELLVQVKQEAMKTKAATVTAQLSISDSLVVAGMEGEGSPLPSDSVEIRISKKLQAAARKELREFGQSIFSETIPTGDLDNPGKARFWVLFRTEASSILRKGEQERIIAQAEHAVLILRQITERAPFLAFGTIHYRSPAPYLRRVGSIPVHEIQKIVTDDEDLFRELMAFFYPTVQLPDQQDMPGDPLSETALTDRWLRNAMKYCDHPVIEFYRDNMIPLFRLQSMTHRLEETLNRTVYLKSGGSLIIEHTEALNVIDVNTGKSEGSRKKGADREKELLKLNLEAASEAARQIRLRNMSGIILIDFINMKGREHDQQLMDHLAHCLAADPVETKLVDMTRLGLVEITRRKVERPLFEVLRPDNR